MIWKTCRHLIAAGLFAGFLLAPNPGLAADEPPVVKALLETTAAASGVLPTYENISEEDGKIIVKGLKGILQSAQGEAGEEQSFSIGELVLSGVSERGDGIFEVATMSYTETEILAGSGEERMSIKMPEIALEQAFIRPKPETPGPLDFLRGPSVLSRQATMPFVLFEMAGKTFIVENLGYAWDGDPATGMGDTNFTIGRFEVDASLFDEEDGKNELRNLGYEKIVISMSGDVHAALDDEGLEMTLSLRQAGDEMAVLEQSFAVDAVPVELLKSVNTLAKQESEPDTNAMMAMAQQIKIGPAKLSLKDSSVTMRILEKMAREAQTDVPTFVAQLKVMLQQSLAEVGVPQLAEMIQTAVGSFLDNPQSLTLAINPADGLTVGTIMQSLNNPPALIELLNVSVTAHE